METPTVLTPRLIVSSANDAIAFYKTVFGANELDRYATPSGLVVHATISIRGALLSLADAHKDWYPAEREEGSPILLTLECEDPDATAKLAEANGATVLIPVGDRGYGRREGRIRDPFGHLWILSLLVEDLSPEQIQKAIDSFG